MKKVEFFDEDNTMVIDSQFDVADITIYPEIKKFDVRSSVKDDCFYNNQTIEYRISADPICLEMRTLESSHEPPLEYSIRDGVVLESEIKKNRFILGDRIENLKKQAEWNKARIFGNYEVNLYILSKHPEIVSKEEYRKFLRQSVERLKMGVVNAEKEVKDDKHGLHFQTGEYGNQIWYLNDEADNNGDDYWKLSKEDREKSEYGKKIKYAEEFNNALFDESSPKYVGIDSYEFQNSKEIIEHVEDILDKRKPIYRGEADKQKEDGKSSGNFRWWIVLILSIIALSWSVWTAIGVFILGNIIISTVSSK